MKTWEKLIDAFYKALLICLIGAFLYVVGLQVANHYNRVEQKLDELYSNDVINFNRIQLVQEVQAKWMKAIDTNSLDRDLALYTMNEKPSYDYLKSLTVIVYRNVGKDKIALGTGVVVKKTEDSTYILTNKHVCDLKAECYILDEDGDLPAQVVKVSSSKYDMALIKVSLPMADKNAVERIGSGTEQQRIYSVGHYLGNFNTYTEGTVAGFQGNYLLVNMPCLYGCSGSGVFNQRGELIGLVFAGNRYNIDGFDTSKALCVPAEVLKLFLADIL